MRVRVIDPNPNPNPNLGLVAVRVEQVAACGLVVAPRAPRLLRAALGEG